ncbi:MAG: tetratricopeptide repeat protein [Bdellovibrionaceae bacterium]|nr:tetratricopeptide repeat protein [Pseudobdellovibrionaceae bacterium]
MRKLYASLLMSLSVTVLVAVLSSCAGQVKKSNNNSVDEAATDDIAPGVSHTSALDGDSRTDGKKIVPASSEDTLNQMIKKQSDADIAKMANDLLMANPANMKALNALGLLNYKKGKYKAAEFFLNKALKTHSNEAGLYNNLAMVKLAQGEQREAVKLLKTGFNQKADDIGIMTNLGAIYVGQKDYPNAEVALEKVYKPGSKDVKVGTNYATSLAANKKYPEATAIYKRLLSDNGSSREIMLNYSIHLIENVKDYKQGLDLINRLKFVGVPEGARNLINDLENKAKSGVK